MGKLVTYLMFGFMCVVGGGSSIFVVLGIPGVLLWKLYRTARYHISPMN